MKKINFLLELVSYKSKGIDLTSRSKFLNLFCFHFVLFFRANIVRVTLQLNDQWNWQAGNLFRRFFGGEIQEANATNWNGKSLTFINLLTAFLHLSDEFKCKFNIGSGF